MSVVDSLLARLDGVQRSGNGYRAVCPACGGKSRKVSVSESDDGRALVHCFGGCDVLAVLQAIGLGLADLFPDRPDYPDNPDSRRQSRRAARESQWGAALDMLSLEANIVLIVGRQLAGWGFLTVEDDARLAVAVERIDRARGVLRDVPSIRPQQVAA